MKFDLHNLQGGNKEFSVVLPAEDVALDSDDASLSSPAQVSGRISQTSGRTRVEGLIDAELDTACTRCLAPVNQHLRAEFTADFVPPEHFSAAAEHEVAGGDLDLDVLESDAIDIAGLVREQILLNMPGQILCSENCKGICATCGLDRNLIDCNCEESEIDPRWAALKGLK